MEETRLKSSKQYPMVESRYLNYSEQKGDKEEAIANRQIEK